MAHHSAALRNNRYVSSTFSTQTANNDWLIECLKIPLLSIEEAVIGLDEFILAVESLAATAKKDCRQNSALTINESAAIYLYSMMNSFYRKLNEALRAENPLALRPWFPFLKLLLTALNKIPSSSATVWRGVRKSIGNDFAEGTVHTWSSINSCSSSLSVAGSFAHRTGTLFCIRVIRGKNIKTYAINQDEEEIVLLPGTRLLVKSVRLDCDSLTIVDLEECALFPAGQHLMLSYHSSNESVVSQIHPMLEKKPLPLWHEGPADKKQSMRDSLAEGVENAAVVCCFISPNYEQSENCQLELQYAHKRGKRVLLFMLCSADSWKPTQWLASIIQDFEKLEYYEESDSDIDYSTMGLIYHIEQKPSTNERQRLRSAKQPIYLYELVKLDYRRNSRIERLMNPSQSFFIEQSYVNLAIVESEDQQEKERQLGGAGNNYVVMDKFEEIYGAKTRVSVKDIFQGCKDNKNQVLVFGRAGIGKSTFCQYSAYQWACGLIWSEYDLVVLVPLRSLTEQNYPPSPVGTTNNLVDVLKKTCFSWNHNLSKMDGKLLQQQIRNDRILWLLDGYDELVQNVPTHLRDLFDKLLKTPHHIITSRSYLNTLSYQVRMEIMGFTDENIPEYIKHFFDQMKSELLNSAEEEKKLLDFLKRNPSIWGIAHIPINLELICSVWSSTDWSDTKAMTITTLYGKLTEWVCRRYLEKQKGISRNVINLMHQQKVYQECKKELAFLESLAFRGMDSNVIILRPQLLIEAEEESQCSFVSDSHLLNIGMLKSITNCGTGSQNEIEKDHYFVHLSFQEYFAAGYIVNALRSDQRQTAIDFIKHKKYNRRFILLLRFASGLSVESKCRETGKLFWDTIQGEPVDLVGIRHMQITMSCFDEIMYHTSFPYRGQLLSSTQDWIEHALNSNNVVLRDHLADCMQSCISIMNESVIQNAFLHMLRERLNPIKHRVLELISAMQHIYPNPDLLCAIADQLLTSDEKLHLQSLTTLRSLGKKAATRQMTDHLLIMMKADNSSAQRGACAAIGVLGESAVTPAVIARLITLLDTEERSVRQSAYEAVADLSESVTTDAIFIRLLIAVHDSDWGIKSSACTALDNIGKKGSTIEVLVCLLDALIHEDPRVRTSVCHVLKRMDQKVATVAVMDRLLIAMRDKDFDVRSSACEVLRSMGERAETSIVIDHLLVALSDVDLRARLSACQILKGMSAKAATRKVIRRVKIALGDEDPGVRSSACEVLRSMGEKAVTVAVIDQLLIALRDEDLDVRSSACEVLRSMHGRLTTTGTIDRLLDVLRDVDPRIRLSACRILQSMGENAANTTVMDRLLIALGDEDPNVRSGVCEVLRGMGQTVATPGVIDRLLDVLRDVDPRVRLGVCRVLQGMGEKVATRKGIRRVVRALGDEDFDVRAGACEVLRGMGETVAATVVTERLLTALRNVDPRVRFSACEVLRSMNLTVATPGVIDHVLNVVKDTDPRVRLSGCRILESMGETVAATGVIDYVLNALRDVDPRIRLSACRILQSMGEKAANTTVTDRLLIALGDEDPNVRSGVCEVLRSMGQTVATPGVITRLMHVLRDVDPRVRVSVFQVLEGMGENEATRTVIGRVVLALSDENPDVRSIACEVLCGMGVTVETPGVIDRLMNVMRDVDPKVRLRACQLLGGMGEGIATNKVISLLWSMLEDEDPRVSGSACEVLESMGPTGATNAVIDRLLEKRIDLKSEISWEVENALSAMSLGTGKWTVIHRCLMYVQYVNVWERNHLLERVRSLQGAWKGVTMKNIALDIAKRFFLKEVGVKIDAVCLACFTIGVGVIRSGNSIFIYGDEEPDHIESPDLRSIEELVDALKGQSQIFVYSPSKDPLGDLEHQRLKRSKAWFKRLASFRHR